MTDSPIQGRPGDATPGGVTTPGVITFTSHDCPPVALDPVLATIAGDFEPDDVTVMCVGQARPRVLDTLDPTLSEFERAPSTTADWTFDVSVATVGSTRPSHET